MDFRRAYELINELQRQVLKVVVGKKVLVKQVLATLVAGGHVLIEGPPGSAKTLISKAVSKAIGGTFSRVQGNPDILPTDLTGYYIYSIDGSKRFVRGPVFANILLFDELNRTPTRVQSALLQAMAERQVSIDGILHDLPRPFHVIATEVPVEQEVGIYSLTLTLRDRFWLKIISEYNVYDEELEIIKRADKLYDIDTSDVEKVVDITDFLELQKFVDKIYVDERIVRYIANLANQIRNHRHVKTGLSHRGPIYLYRISKVIALMNQRDYVIPDDVKEIAINALAHRISISEEAVMEGLKPEDIVKEALEKVEVPKE